MAEKNQISLRIKAIVDGLKDIDKLVNEIEALGGEAGDTGAEAKKLNQEFERLKKQQDAIDQFSKLNAQIQKTKTDLSDAAVKSKELEVALASAERPTKALSNAAASASDRVRRLKEIQSAQLTTLDAYRNKMKAAGVDTNRLTAEQVRLAGATASVKGRIASIASDLEKTRQGYRSAGDAAGGFGRAGEKSSKTVRTGIKSISDQLAAAKTQLLGFFGVRYAANMVQDLGRVSDEWKNITARLEQATGSQAELASAQQEAFRIAQESRTALDDVANLYSRLRISLKEYNVSQEETFKLTEAMTQAMQVSGASQEESAATLQQLSQAFASGVLRGDEFNSMMEQGPRLAKALADGLGVPVSALRGMAEAGEITAERLRTALVSQAGVIALEYEKLPLTIEGAVARLENAWLKFIGTQDQAAGASGKVAESLSYISQHLDEVAQAALVVGEVMTAAFAVKGVKAIGAYVASARLGATVTLGIGAAATESAAKVGLLAKSANLMGSAFVGWEIGKYLRDNFEEARLAGLFLVEGLVTGAEKVRFAWEVAKAVYTDDTIEAAIQRHNQRLQEIQTTFADMQADAKGLGDAQVELSGKTDAATQSFSDLERQMAAVEQPVISLGEAAGNAAVDFEKLGIDVKQILSDLETNVPRATQAITAALSNPALKGDGLLRFFDEVVSKSSNLAAVEAAINRYGQALEQNELTAEQQTQVSQALSAALDEVERAMRGAADASTGNSQSIYELADSYRQGTKSAKEFYTELQQISEAQQVSDQRQKQHTETITSGYKKAGDAAGQYADDVQKSEQSAGEARQQGLNGFADFWKRVYDTYHGISDAAGRAYDKIFEYFKRMGVASQDYNFVLKTVHDRLEDIDRMVKGQTINAADYTENLTRALNEAKAAVRNMEVLDAQKLSQLRSEIIRTQQALDSLNSSAKSTLNSLKQELAGVIGDEIQSEMISYQVRLEELRSSLEEARRSGASEAVSYYQDAIRYLNQIHQQRLNDIRAEQSAQQTRSESASGQTMPGAAPTNPLTNNGGRSGLANNLVEVRFSNGGLGVSGYFDPQGVSTMLDVLQQAGATTE